MSNNMSMNLDNIEKIDFLGGQIGFYHNNRLRKRSAFGAIMTVILVIIAVTFSILIGKDFFERLNPKIIHEEVFEDIRPTYTINNKNFSLATRLNNVAGLTIANDRMFYWEAHHYYGNNINNTGEFNLTINKIPLNKCTEDFFAPNKTFIGHELWMCPELDNVKFGGGWLDPDINYLHFKVYECVEGNLNPKNQTCEKKEIAQQIYDDKLFLSVGLNKKIIEATNVENGIDFVVDYDFAMLDGKMITAYFNYIESVKLESDIGWLFKSVKSFQILSHEYSTSLRYDLIKVPADQNKQIGDILIFLSRKKHKILRSYTKLPSYLSEIGGFCEFLYVFGFIIVGFYNMIDFKFKFLSSVIPDKILDKEIDTVTKNKTDLDKHKKINTMNENDLNSFKIPTHKRNLNNLYFASERNDLNNEDKLIESGSLNNFNKNKHSRLKVISLKYNLNNHNKENEEIINSTSSKRDQDCKIDLSKLMRSNCNLKSEPIKESPSSHKNDKKKTNGFNSNKSLPSLIAFEDIALEEKRKSFFLKSYNLDNSNSKNTNSSESKKYLYENLSKIKKQMIYSQEKQNIDFVNVYSPFKTFKYIFFKTLSYPFPHTQTSLKIKLVDKLFNRLENSLDIKTLVYNNIRLNCITNFLSDEKNFAKTDDDNLNDNSPDNKIDIESELMDKLKNLL
jgi:hypothetical protein